MAFPTFRWQDNSMNLKRDYNGKATAATLLAIAKKELGMSTTTGQAKLLDVTAESTV
jgi:hypothetical protein